MVLAMLESLKCEVSEAPHFNVRGTINGILGLLVEVDNMLRPVPHLAH